MPPEQRRSKARTRFEHAQRRALRKGTMNIDGSLAVCEEEQQANLLCVRDARNDLETPPREVVGVIPIVFSFYSRLQMPGAQLAQRGVTYEEIKHCNDRMSFFELLTLCRDFGMIPGVVSKQNLHYVWTVCLAEHHRSTNREHFRHTGNNGQLRDAGVDIEEFLAVLARIALIAYAESAVGDPKLAVRKLAEFMQLSNLKNARWILRTKGRATQRRLYYRSRSEKGRDTSKAVIDEGKAILQQKRKKKEAAANMSDNDDQIFTESQLDRLETQPKWADVMGTAQSNVLTLAQRVMLAQFDKSLIVPLKAFCSKMTKHYFLPFNTFGFDFDAPLRKGKSYRIRLEIINKSKTMLVVTGLKKVGNVVHSVSAKFAPKPFASGLKRFIHLTVTPHTSPDTECGGILLVTLSSTEDEGQKCLVLEVPIYYTISPDRYRTSPNQDDSDNSSTDSNESVDNAGF